MPVHSDDGRSHQRQQLNQPSPQWTQLDTRAGLNSASETDGGIRYRGDLQQLWLGLWIRGWGELESRTSATCRAGIFSRYSVNLGLTEPDMIVKTNQDCSSHFDSVYIQFEWSGFYDELTRRFGLSVKERNLNSDGVRFFLSLHFVSLCCWLIRLKSWTGCFYFSQLKVRGYQIVTFRGMKGVRSEGSYGQVRNNLQCLVTLRK